jgi:uncharacterized protein YndB with AHSA1/START domain
MPDLQPRPFDWLTTAPVRIEATREMAVSAAAAFAVVADHERWPEWFTQLKRVEVTGAPTGVGGQRRVALAGVVVDEVFIAWEPDRLFAFTLTHASRPMAKAMVEAVQVEPLGDDRCRVTYTQALEPHGWMKPMLPLMRRTMRSMLAKALSGLEQAARH